MKNWKPPKYVTIIIKHNLVYSYKEQHLENVHCVPNYVLEALAAKPIIFSSQFLNGKYKPPNII